MIEWSGILWKIFISKLGVHGDFVNLLMKCVRKVKYCIKVNHELTEELIPQGSSFPLYIPLFILNLCQWLFFFVA